MEKLWQDLRYGWRMLSRYPGITAITVVTLALGVGANTAIFSVVNALLFKPLPYPDSHQLMAIGFDNEQPLGHQFWPYPKFAAFRDLQSSFDPVAAYYQTQVTIAVGDRPERAPVEIVTASYFPLLGIKPAIGRAFLPEEDHSPGLHPVVVLGHRLWQQHFAGDEDVIGKTIYLRKHSFTVVGIMPPQFRGQSGAAELWAPMMMAEELMYPDALKAGYAWWLRVIGRLKPGVTEEQARAAMPILSRKVAELAPAQLDSMLTKSGEELIKLIPLKEIKIDPAVRRSFVILLAVVGFVLLIASANTANLLLSRAITRQREFAVRLSLGAGRWRIVRQVLTESVLLAVIGGAAGLLVAVWSIDWLTTAKPWNTVGFWSQYARTFDYFAVELEWSMIGFNFLLAGVTGIIVGLMPALSAARLPPNQLLKENAASTVTGFYSLRRPRAGAALVISDIALSLVLLTGAGLLIKSFIRLSAVELGFEPDGVTTMSFSAEGREEDFYRSFLDRVRQLPEIESASLSLTTPLTGTQMRGPVEFEGRPSLETPGFRAVYNVVTPDYLKTFRIAVLNGRGFADQDGIASTRVALVNKALASSAFPGHTPLGKRLKTPFRVRYSGAEEWIQIVGVVGDVKYGTVEEAVEPAVYLPAWQPLGTPKALSLAPQSLSIRTAFDSASLIAAVRSELHSLDAAAPLSNVTTMRERASRVTSRYRYSTMLVGSFAALALLLSSMGIYGVMTYGVERRNHEVGVRMALGAQRWDVLQLLLREGVILIVAGVAIGLAAALVLTRVLEGLLFGVSPTDPATFAFTALLLTSVGLLACYLPAHRATRIDPITALRYE